MANALRFVSATVTDGLAITDGVALSDALAITDCLSFGRLELL